MNDNQEYEEQARKLDQFHDKYHQQKQPNWLNSEVEAEAEGTATTGTYDVGRRTIEIAEQQQEDIRKHLEGVIKRMEQVVDSPVEITMKRIEVDAATIAVLAIVSELLPEQIQEQLRTIVTLHEKTWQIDIPAVEGETPRKPLSEELIETIAREDDSSEV
jgi:Asp-tRNA(Asn)/Glu-tRNA(Gln) amidotransferase C subunit